MGNIAVMRLSKAGAIDPLAAFGISEPIVSVAMRMDVILVGLVSGIVQLYQKPMGPGGMIKRCAGIREGDHPGTEPLADSCCGC